MTDQKMSLMVNFRLLSPYAGDCIPMALASSVLPHRERRVVPLEPTGGISTKLGTSLCERIRERSSKD